MSDFFGSIWWLIVAIGVLVSWHEFGHFWVARRYGVKVLRFSVGFGKPLWSRVDRHGTEFAVAAIPLGGYVKMLDEREGPVAAQEVDQSFNTKPVGQRMAIVAAGPVFNLVFTIVAFWVMFMVGVPEIRPIVGETSGIAAAAGIEEGDEITRIGDDTTRTWTNALLSLVSYGLDREPTRVTIRKDSGRTQTVELRLDQLPEDVDEAQIIEATGLSIWQPTFTTEIGEVVPDSPAAAADLRPGDRITYVNDTPVTTIRELGDAIRQHGDGGQSLALEVVRGEQRLIIPVTPALVDGRLQIGISSAPPPPAVMEKYNSFAVMERFGPLAAISASFKETWHLTKSTFALIGHMLSGDASLKNLSGPIGIAQFANQSAQSGVSRFLHFLGLLSLSLAILNFLPIPLLDGGQLLYFAIEWVRGRPVPENVQIVGQYIGLSALALLMSLTFYNDILRLLS